MSARAGSSHSLDALVAEVLKGDRGAVAQAISLLENDAPECRPLLDRLHAHTGRAWRIGLTGPPGSGKSTLMGQLTRILRGQKQTVGILAVDPTSPYTGGALLGDRIRLAGVEEDPGVFMRSMATRGMLGGIARATTEAANLLDASGKQVILIESVGVGQAEVELSRTVDTTLVVLSPESGDSIQAMKSGLLETADILVVNKADREGALAMKQGLESLLHLSTVPREWTPPVMTTTAISAEGIAELWQEVERHRRFLEENSRLQARRNEHLRDHLLLLVRSRIEKLIQERLVSEGELQRALESIEKGKTKPYEVSEEWLRRWFPPSSL